MIDELKMAARFARDIRGFLSDPLKPEECQAWLRTRLAQRSQTFLQLMQQGVFGQPRSPYLALIKWAGLDYDEIARCVEQTGVEGAIARLYDAGVYVTIDEFKARKPILRPGLELPVHDGDFDNPLILGHYEVRSSGTRSVGGVGRRMTIDLNMLAYEAHHDLVFLSASDSFDRPLGLWRPAPPGSAGLKNLLLQAHLGRRAERWFSQNTLKLAPGFYKYFFFAWFTVLASRLYNAPLPAPDYTPLEQAEKVARWLAQKTAQGRPGYVDTNAGSMVRICLAAKEHGLDIHGTVFRTGGEPLTTARAQLVTETGCRIFHHYSMSEIGRVGVACTDPVALDDVHIVSDKVTLLQREKQVGSSDVSVGALYCTTLYSGVPRVMLNVEVGDYGVLSERACNCPWHALGYPLHLHTIRSYEKLTSEGMHFMGVELVNLVEEVLPARFGGHPTDYQFVEEEENGLTKVSIVVSPRVGAVNESQLVEAVLASLGSRAGGNQMMAQYWQDGKTLRVVRREPYATSASKIQTLHVIKH